MNDIQKLTSLPTAKATPSNSVGLASRKSSVGASAGASASKGGIKLNTGVLGFLGSLGSSALNYFTSRRAEKSQRELLERQRSQFLEDRRHDEEYNSPSAMLSRMRVAGISPTSLSNVAQTDSTGGQISGDANSVGNSILSQGQAIQSGFSSALDALALNKQRAEIDKLYSDVANSSSDRIVKDLNASFLRQSLGDRVAQEHFKVLSDEMGLSRLRADINRIMSLTGLTEVQKKERDLAYRLSVDTYDSSVKLARFQASNAELDNKIKDFDLNKTMPAELVRIYELTNNIRQGTYLNYARYVNESKHLESMTGQIDENTKSLSFANKAMQDTYDKYVQSLIDTYHITSEEAKYAATMHWAKIISSCAASVGGALAIGLGFRRGGKVPNRVQDSGTIPNYGYSSSSSWDYPMLY